MIDWDKQLTFLHLKLITVPRGATALFSVSSSTGHLLFLLHLKMQPGGGGGVQFCGAQNVRWNAADGPGRTIKRTADAPSFEVTLANGRGRTDQDALQSCPASPLADGCTRGKYFCCPNVEFFFFWGPHVEFDSVNVSLISLVIVSCFIRAVNTDGSNMWNASSSGAR